MTPHVEYYLHWAIYVTNICGFKYFYRSYDFLTCNCIFLGTPVIARVDSRFYRGIQTKYTEDTLVVFFKEPSPQFNQLYNKDNINQIVDNMPVNESQLGPGMRVVVEMEPDIAILGTVMGEYLNEYSNSSNNNRSRINEDGNINSTIIVNTNVSTITNSSAAVTGTRMGEYLNEHSNSSNNNRSRINEDGNINSTIIVNTNVSTITNSSAAGSGTVLGEYLNEYSNSSNNNRSRISGKEDGNINGTIIVETNTSTITNSSVSHNNDNQKNGDRLLVNLTIRLDESGHDVSVTNKKIWLLPVQMKDKGDIRHISN